MMMKTMTEDRQLNQQPTRQSEENEKQRRHQELVDGLLGDKSKDATVKELEQVDPLGAKPKLMSKATTAANKAAKRKQTGTTNPTPATKTTAASRKPTISFAD